MRLNTIILIIIAVIIGFAVCYVLGYVGISPFTMLTSTVNGYMANFNLGDLVKNPANVIAIATPAISAATLAYKWIEEKRKLAQTQAAAISQITQYKTALAETGSALEKSIALNQTQASDAGLLQEKLTTVEQAKITAESAVTTLQKEREKLTYQIEDLTSIAARAKTLADGKAVLKTIVE